MLTPIYKLLLLLLMLVTMMTMFIHRK